MPMKRLVLYSAATLVALIACSDAANKTSIMGPANGPSFAVSGSEGAIIATDKDDYAPGERVTITGTAWAAGEPVHLTLVEDPVQDGTHEWDVTASESGTFTDTSFAPGPQHLGVTFTLTATGPISGVSTQLTFTDGNFRVQAVSSAAPTTFNLTWSIYSTTNCTGPTSSSGTDVVTQQGNSFSKGVGATQSIRLAAALVTTSPSAPTKPFRRWEAPAGIIVTTVNPQTICAQGTAGNNSENFNAVYNTPPVAEDDAAQTTPGTLVDVNVLANDSDEDQAASTLAVTIVAGPASGTVAVRNDKTIRYTPPAAFTGTATFTYRVTDGQGDSDDATVTVTVAPNTRTLTVVRDGTGAGSVVSTPTGINCGTTCSASFTTNAVVTLTATAAAGSLFDSWSSDCDVVEGPKCAVTLSADKTVTATFKAIPVFANLASPTITYAAAATTALGGKLATSGGTPATGSVSITVNGVTQNATLGSDGSFSSTFSTGALAAGSYPIVYAYAGNSSFAPAQNGAGTLQVNKAPSSVSVANIPSNAVYGGSFTPTFSAIGDGAISVASLTTGTCTVSNGKVSFVAAGLCQLRASIGAGTNYLASVGATQFFTIGQVPLTITVSTGLKKTYGEVDPALTYQLTGTMVGTDVLSGALSREAGENAGTYSITQGTLAASTNYDVTFVEAEFIIEQRVASVTPANNNKRYGDSDPSPLTSGALVGFLAKDNVQATYTRAAGESVAGGPYTISAVLSPASVLCNYKITYNTATFAITPRPVTVKAEDVSAVYGDAPSYSIAVSAGSLGNGDALAVLGTPSFSTTPTPARNVGTYTIAVSGLSSANYTIGYATGELTVTPRKITVTAAAKSKTYGDDDPALTYSVTTGSLVYDDEFDGGLTRAAGEDVGTYAITKGTLSAGDNYDLAFVGASLTISARHVTVTADPKSKVYGNAEPALTYKITDGSLAFSDAFAGSLTRAAGEDVGTYAIQQGTLALSSNYVLTYAGADLKITERPITVTAAAKTKVYGNGDPALTYALTSGNLVNGDVLTGALARATGEDVGSYAITQGSLAATTNYALSFVGANLTISARPISVKANDLSKVFGQPEPALTYQVTGSLAFSDAFSGSLVRAPGELVGKYGISQGSLALSANYALTFVGGTFTVLTQYRLSLFLEPINAAGTRSSFKQGSTIPVKFRLTLLDGTPANVGTARLQYTQSDPTADIAINEPIDVSTVPDAGNIFRNEDSQFIYNLGTKPMQSGTWWLIAVLPDGSRISQQIDLRAK